MKLVTSSLLAGLLFGAPVLAQAVHVERAGFPGPDRASRQNFDPISVGLGGTQDQVHAVSVPRFDPALGQLQSVEIVTESIFDCSVQVSANLPFILPLYNNLTVRVDSEFQYFAPGMRHTQDVAVEWSGREQANWPTNVSQAWAAGDRTDGPDVRPVDASRTADWVGAGQTHDIFVQVTNTFSGSSTLASTAHWSSAFNAQIEVRYHYTPRLVGRFDTGLPGQGISMIHFEPATTSPGYQIQPTGPLLDLDFADGTPLNMGDDTFHDVVLSTPVVFPGRRLVTSVRIDSNGRLTDAFELMGSDYSPTPAKFLNAPSPVIAPLWTDLNPAFDGQVWVKETTEGLTVTWDDIAQYGATNSNFVQVQIRTNGAITFFYRNLEIAGGRQIIGVSEGRGVADPGAVDLTAFNAPLSEVIYEDFGGSPDLNTDPANGYVLIDGMPTVGQDLRLQFLGPYSAASQGFLFLSSRQHVAIGPMFLNLFFQDFFLRVDPSVSPLSVPTSGFFNIPVPNDPMLVGLQIGAQGVVIDPAITGNPLGLGLTRGYQITFGE